jgi:hypothetical protein
MPLRRKPSTPASDISARDDAPLAVDERRIDDLIDKGGTVAFDAPPPDPRERTSLPIRLDATLIARIDRARARRRLPPPRLSWILEALLEKLAREKAR